MRRAPRLGPGTYLAPLLARRGRFARVDPLKPRPLPGIARILGVAGWSGLLGYAGWQAWRRRDSGEAPSEG